MQREGRGNGRAQRVLPWNAVERRRDGRQTVFCPRHQMETARSRMERRHLKGANPNVCRRHGRYGRYKSEHEQHAQERDILYSTWRNSRRKPLQRQAQYYIPRTYQYFMVPCSIFWRLLPSV
jgi:hypothetical protein